MRKSTERILTTHTGSLPRPADLLALLAAREAGGAYDPALLVDRWRDSVQDVVRAQIDTGIDVVSDGEMGKIGYSTYVKNRLTGFEGEPSIPFSLPDLAEFPEYAARLFGEPAIREMKRPACSGPIAYKGHDELRVELETFRGAVREHNPTDAFVTAASPGVIAMFLDNVHYPTHEAYVFALAEAMREEYEAIHRAGFVLQLDCPDLAMTPALDLHVEALNFAVGNIPRDCMRLHVCWGNYEGPHHKDAPLERLIASLLRARPDGLSFAAANARHEHEWRVFEAVRLPLGKILIPGVIDSTTNIVEHPRVVADRICRFAAVVGRENVIAGTDCGFATFAQYALVDPKIAWAKLGALAEGARLAEGLLGRSRTAAE